MMLIVLVIFKRTVMKGGYSMLSELLAHITTMVLFYIVSRLYSHSHLTTRYIPYVYAVILYYSHTIFTFKGSFDEPNNPSQVSMSKDNLFRHIIQFGALSFNLLYIGVFLVFTRRDCILPNSLTFLLLLFDVFT
jgi:putative flippase GtrA